MVKQYVGARYVPKFANPVAWTSGTSYEALTIVSYNNASYTSKIPVPATVGNPADNSDYWALTGNYNAQVEEYRQATLQVQENLNEEINNREESDTALNTKLTQEIMPYTFDWTQRNTLVLGDSYGDEEGEWTYLLRSYLGCDNSNMHIIAVSGAYFRSTLGSNTFQSQLENYTGDKSAITDIIVGGGLNDSQGLVTDGKSSELNSSIDAFVEYAHTNYPNAKLWLAYIGNALDDSSVLYGRNMRERIMCFYIYKGRPEFTFLDGAQYALNANVAYFASDRLHPSRYGSTSIATCIASLLRGGGQTCGYPIWPAGNGLYYMVMGGQATIFTYQENQVVLHMGTTMSDGFNDAHEILESDNIYFNVPLDVPMTVQISDTTKGIISRNILLRFTGTKIQVQNRTIVDSAWEVINGNTDLTIYVEPFSVTFPAWIIN